MLDERKQMLLNQVMILVFAAVIAFFSQYLWYIFALYIVVLGGVMYYSFRRGGSKSAAILSGKKLYEEKHATKIMMMDKDLDAEMKEQFSGMMKGMGVMLLALIGVWIAFERLSALAASWDALYRFAAYLALFEAVFIVMRVANTRIMGRQSGMFIVPPSYTVTDKGIVGGGGVAIEFPLKDYELIINEKRGFVELVPRATAKKTSMARRVRLYARDVKRLSKILESFKQSA